MSMLRNCLVALGCLLIVGCAAFPAGKTASVTPVDVSAFQHRPSVFVNVKFFGGSPEDSRAMENAYASNQVQPIVAQAFAETGYFSKVSFDLADRETADHALDIAIYNHGNHGLAAVGGFITGLSLFVIPSAATDKYHVAVKILDKASSATMASVVNDDAVTTWVGIWFLPMAGKTPIKGIELTLKNQVKAALTQFVEAKQFHYSLLGWPARG